MEFLITSACLALREEGTWFVSLPGAPLVRSRGSAPARAVDRVLDAVGARMEPYCWLRSLHAVNAKFQRGASRCTWATTTRPTCRASASRSGVRTCKGLG